MKPILLSDGLKVSYRGKVSDSKYRAMLIKDHNTMIVSIDQQSGSEWIVQGKWQLKTLLFGFPECLGHKPSDRLSIDHGQQWQVESGMLIALSVAIHHV